MGDQAFLVEHAYWIALLPLVSSALIFFFGRWLPAKGAWLGILAIAGSLLMSFDLFMRLMDGTLKVPYEVPWPWFSAGYFPFEWGLLLDGTSITLLVMVTTVSLLVQVYSLGYMDGAPRFKRFYGYLSLFTFSMLGLVLANNYLQFFVGWEIMGACSYFLISFEFEREAAAVAGNKGFFVTRIGDLGLYAALLLIFLFLGTFNFGQINEHLHDGALSVHQSMLIALLLFWAAVGKSAQFPLHVWLPDAMEGPTPVSALIHAATMVAAGVYLVTRSYGFFTVAPDALHVVAWTGGITALLAATMAVTAGDLKQVLAYSTISQLGYMMLALGLGGYTAGLFHLTTHAAFKALLFLAAGSVIHAVHTNDLWKMGSLSKQMVLTSMTFFVGALALAGVPPFAGYYSKGMILSVAYQSHQWFLFGMACFGVFLTAFYMTRAFSLTFLGDPRERDRFANARESSWSMTIPLIILALITTGLGIWLAHDRMAAILFSWAGSAEAVDSFWVEAAALSAVAAGVLVGVVIYLGNGVNPASMARTFSPIYQLLLHKWYINELYDVLFVRPTLALARGLAWIDSGLIDRVFVDGLSRENGWGISRAGGLIRRMQNGLVQNYLLVITLGFIAFVVFVKLF